MESRSSSDYGEVDKGPHCQNPDVSLDLMDIIALYLISGMNGLSCFFLSNSIIPSCLSPVLHYVHLVLLEDYLQQARQPL